MPETRRILGERDGVEYVAGAYEALQGADALALVTEWKEFRSPDFDQIKAMLKHPVIFDGRNVYNPELLAHLGFSYYGIGRGLKG
jgi:UDPglucose 6-dehydrogenase